ncbi:hypothetical protein T01_10052, partial [Trichinella spiralis]
MEARNNSKSPTEALNVHIYGEQENDKEHGRKLNVQNIPDDVQHMVIESLMLKVKNGIKRWKTGSKKSENILLGGVGSRKPRKLSALAEFLNDDSCCFSYFPRNDHRIFFQFARSCLRNVLSRCLSYIVLIYLIFSHTGESPSFFLSTCFPLDCEQLLLV